LNCKKGKTIKQTLGAKVLGLEKKSSDRKLRAVKKKKIKKRKKVRLPKTIEKFIENFKSDP